MDPKEALEIAFKVVGGRSAMARKLGITPQAVGQWEKAPVRQAIPIERACEGRVTRNQLRPDIYQTEAA